MPVTPRKRKAGSSDASTPLSKGKGKARGPPTPNPPIAPFPTPPSSRHRHQDAIHAGFDDATLPDRISPESDDLENRFKPLPPGLDNLLQLQRAFNLALALHFATNPPVLPPHSPSTTKLLLPNLTNYLAIKGTVERTAGRRFGLPELGRLAWLWTWDGLELPIAPETSVNSIGGSIRVDNEDLANPFLVKEEPSSRSNQVLGLTYLVTPTRTLDPSSGRRVHTYGVGIELDLRAGETRNVLDEQVGGSSGTRGQGGGTGAVSRWSSTGDGREMVVRQRLDRWVELHGGYEPPQEIGDYPTPQTSETSRSNIPPIPLLPLPKLPSATLLPAAQMFSSEPPISAPTPASSSKSESSGLADPFVLQDKKGKVVHTGSVEDRRKAMMDRIRARKGTQPTLGSSIGKLDQIRPRMSTTAQAEELKRRSTLSRLEGVAEAVWMMFSAPSPGPSTLPTPPRGRRKAIPLSEAADVIVKSSKTPISLAEAQDSLKMLTELCPFFLVSKVVAKKEWLEMPAAFLATCPASPGSSTTPRISPQSYPSPSARSRAQISDPPTSPSPSSKSTLAPREPVSPSPSSRTTAIPVPRSPTSPTSKTMPPPSTPTSSGRRTMMPREPVSPTFKKSPRLPSSPSLMDKRAGLDIAGAASPGRVLRYGGLRQVRERIRRELGDNE